MGTHQNSLNDDDEFRFNNMSTHEGYLCQNGILTWFAIATAIMIGHLHNLHEAYLMDTHNQKSSRSKSRWPFSIISCIKVNETDTKADAYIG